ncbi:protein hinderin isoform X2 [Denticeps clupeoides]|uniref:Protein hinderin n=1 Tax=Denticeps clupeoides TaxID=299321 RepID=A0AAY4AEK3_9TELE|nr:protein hinderin isoform X2 [Denticeps clupeoides]
MAVVAEGRIQNRPGISWSYESDELQSVVFVPGVSRNTSGAKHQSRVRGHKAGPGNERGVRKNPTNISSSASVGKMPLKSSSDSKTNSTRTSVPILVPPVVGLSQTILAGTRPSLKDLCPEDKRRIANLIQELARVSEEKDVSMQKLKDEQETFERKIDALEKQNHLIIQERESMQQQYRECQQLLTLYQQYLSEQKERLNQSLARRRDSHHKSSRSSRSERGSSRCCCAGVKGGCFDAPYRNLPAPKSSSRGGFQSCACGATPAVPSCTAGSETDPPLQAPRAPSGGRNSNREGPVNTTSGQQGTREIQESLIGSGGSARREPVPPVGLEDWEEKSRQLLEQKRKLEEERERLQQKLALHEESLQQQQKELQLARAGHNSNHQTVPSEEPLLTDPNTATLSPVPPNSSKLAVHSEIIERALAQDERKGQMHVNHSQAGATLTTKRDMGTSPMLRHAPFPPTHTPLTPPSRLDSSTIELLEIFSPVSVPDQSYRPHLPRWPLSASRPPRKSLFSPTRQSYSHQANPEESQILEDIFFIC